MGKARNLGRTAQDTSSAGTGAFDLPAGTTAERPATASTGMVRYNTTESQYEVYKLHLYYQSLQQQGDYLLLQQNLQRPLSL